MQSQRFLARLKDVFWTLTAVAVIPSLAFWLVGRFLFIDRAIINVDYMVLCMLLIPFGRLAVVPGIVLILILDLTFSMAPAYHFSLASVADSFTELAALNPAFLAVQAGKLTLAVLACALLMTMSLKRVQSVKTVVLTCLACAIGVTVLDVRLSANGLAANEAYRLNTNIAASSLNNLRLALSTADSGPDVQMASPMQGASDVLRDPTSLESGSFKTVILVVVESLGVISDPALDTYQMEPILALKNQPGIVLKSGSVDFEGSTVPAELRELCGIRLLAIHPDPSILPAGNCLPAAYGNRGYETLAIHGYTGTLFSRSTWYPSLQFDEIWFAPQLEQNMAGASRCGIAFHGICDSEIWALIEGLANRETDTKQFIYWLTLSAHLPVETPAAFDAGSCGAFDQLARHPALCRLLFWQRELLSNIAATIRQGRLPNTRILLVGDHMPPFLDTKVRALFDPHRVPYVDIRIRNDN